MVHVFGFSVFYLQLGLHLSFAIFAVLQVFDWCGAHGEPPGVHEGVVACVQGQLVCEACPD